MKQIDSDALGIINKALGLEGAGSPITELADGVVDQVLSINEISRRGRTLAGNEGIFTGLLQNAHAGSGTLTSSVFPYAVAVGAIDPYPSPMPTQFDIWLLSVALRRVAGAAGLNDALVVINYTGRQQGFGVDAAAAAVVSLGSMAVAHFDALTTAGVHTAGIDPIKGLLIKTGIRLPRDLGLSINFVSISAGVATFVLDLVLGVFPVSLGQDGLV